MPHLSWTFHRSKYALNARKDRINLIVTVIFCKVPVNVRNPNESVGRYWVSPIKTNNTMPQIFWRVSSFCIDFTFYQFIVNISSFDISPVIEWSSSWNFGIFAQPYDFYIEVNLPNSVCHYRLLWLHCLNSARKRKENLEKWHANVPAQPEVLPYSSAEQARMLSISPNMYDYLICMGGGGQKAPLSNSYIWPLDSLKTWHDIIMG